MKEHYYLFLVLFTFQLSGQTTLQDQIYQARDQVLPALVHVEPVKKVYNRGEKQRALVTGSGVIFSGEGYVLTNHHVAGNAEKVWCTLSTRQRITATVVGSDPSTDIAVLRLNLEELQDAGLPPRAYMGDSDGLEVGQIVLALGSPLGLSRSVSMGVVSSIDRYFPDNGSMISPYNLWIQTDAAINPGNSGGPLIDLAGRVVGINARAVFLADNLGFAIPINLVKEVAAEIIEGSSVKRSWVGVDFQEIKDFRDYRGEPDFSGVLVSSVEPGSPAAAAGIQPGDVFRRIGSRGVNAVYEEDLPAVRKVMSRLELDRPTLVTIWRDGQEMNVSIRAIEVPLRADEPEFDATSWGLVVSNLSWQVYQMHMMDDFKGVYVTSVKPGGPAEVSNLRGSDVIRKINGETVKDSDAFQKRYESLRDSNVQWIYLELLRSGFPYFAVLKQVNGKGGSTR